MGLKPYNLYLEGSAFCAYNPKAQLVKNHYHLSDQPCTAHNEILPNRKKNPSTMITSSTARSRRHRGRQASYLPAATRHHKTASYEKTDGRLKHKSTNPYSKESPKTHRTRHEYTDPTGLRILGKKTIMATGPECVPHTQ